MAKCDSAVWVDWRVFMSGLISFQLWRIVPVNTMSTKVFSYPKALSSWQTYGELVFPVFLKVELVDSIRIGLRYTILMSMLNLKSSFRNVFWKMVKLIQMWEIHRRMHSEAGDGQYFTPTWHIYSSDFFIQGFVLDDFLHLIPSMLSLLVSLHVLPSNIPTMGRNPPQRRCRVVWSRKFQRWLCLACVTYVYSGRFPEAYDTIIKPRYEGVEALIENEIADLQNNNWPRVFKFGC